MNDHPSNTQGPSRTVERLVRGLPTSDGAGVRLTACRQFTTGHGLRWGVCGVFEAINWWGQPVDGQDHWHGLAPVAAVGLMVY